MKPFFLFLLSLFYAPFAFAVSTDWGNAALLEAGTTEDGYLVGIEFTLNPGWHTYWHHPGPFGIPAQLDFLLSDNVESAEIIYPAPKLVGKDGAYSIGYEDYVILPVIIRPKDINAPVTLNLNVNFGVCEEICIPSQIEVREKTLMTENKLGQAVITPWLQKPVIPSDNLPFCNFEPNEAGGRLELTWQDVTQPAYPIVVSQDPAWVVQDTRDFKWGAGTLTATNILKQNQKTALARQSFDSYIFTPSGGVHYQGCKGN